MTYYVHNFRDYLIIVFAFAFYMVDIYVLECEDGNVYVGKTSKGEKRLKQHISGRGAEWTKLHKPKRVMQYYTNATDADERKVTDQMIKKYGAKKVRGAGLTKRKMSKKEIDNLNKKIGFSPKKNSRTTTTKKASTTKKKTTTYTCSRCGRQGHNRTQCYAKSNSSGKSLSAAKKTTTRKSSASKTKKPVKKKSTTAKKAWKPKPKPSVKKSTRSTSRRTTRGSSKKSTGYRRR